jgi:hypothetical protein
MRVSSCLFVSLLLCSCGPQLPKTVKSPVSAPAGEASVEEWVERLREAATEGEEPFLAVMRERAPQFNPGLAFRPEYNVKIDILYGQLDTDPAPETAVHLLYASETTGAGEASHLSWVGLFDRQGTSPRLVGTREELLYYCDWDDADFGATSGFYEASEGPGFWIEVQETESCGTLIQFDYRRFRYSLKGDELIVEERPALTTGVRYDRLETLSE